MSAHRSFTDGEDAFIRANYLTMDTGDIANHLGRSKSGVSHRAARLGIQKRPIRRWTTKEDQFIQDHHTERLEWVAEQLGRHRSVVSERAKRLGCPFANVAQWGEHSAGYKQLRKQDNGKRTTIWEHIEIMEQHLGRSLCKPELVHHINGTKTDNRIDNLYLCRDKQHHLLVHRSLDKLLPELLRLGIVEFDRERGVYQLCATES